MKSSGALVSVMVLLAGGAAAQVQPAARVGGMDVSISDVDALAGERLAKVRNDEYQIRRQVLDALIEKRLVEAEAAARKVSPAELEKAEITAKVEAVTLEQVRAVYEASPEKYTAMSEEQALSQIATILQRTRLATARKNFLAAARQKYGVKVLLAPPRVSVDTAGAQVKGPVAAPVTLITFSDFQCPYCLRVNPTLKAIEAKYAGQVRFVFKDFPLGIHKDARKASEAGQCAGEQGKFWEMHDRMFANQQKLQPDSLKTLAKEIGIDGSTFGSCLDGGQMAAKVAADMTQGNKLGVTGTPAFFINGRFLSGAQSIERFAEIIDDELSRAAERKP